MAPDGAWCTVHRRFALPDGLSLRLLYQQRVRCSASVLLRRLSEQPDLHAPGALRLRRDGNRGMRGALGWIHPEAGFDARNWTLHGLKPYVRT
jgi:hypothetical protein